MMIRILSIASLALVLAPTTAAAQIVGSATSAVRDTTMSLS